MKNLEFADYTASVEDAEGDSHESTVRAAVITEDLVYVKDANGNNARREVMTPTGARQVVQGDVFVETETPGVYDHLTAEAWNSTGYSGEDVEVQDSVPAKRTARKLPSDGNA